jgi:hypothetical protein
MNRSLICTLLGSALILAPVAAMAAHGRAGLWTVTSTMSMPDMPQIPPQALEAMKARGIPLPGQPFTTQMCMTQEQVNADKPPPTHNADVSCDTKLLSSSPSAMHSQIVCKGRVNGTGDMQISWRGTDHYESTYSFQGTAEGGRPQNMTQHATGDFVKADCGSVKPMGPPPAR